MARDPRYDILFEPLKIGPVTAKNRFFQVPHCSGMGLRYPSAEAAMRGVKAEGGWAVVCTQECEIHPTTEVSPFTEARLWDDRDIPYLARMVDEVHAHDALAGIELVHMGYYGMNLYSREPLISPSGEAAGHVYPGYARAMTRKDIRDVRRWHRQAAIRARRAGYDIVVVYAGHNISLAMHFLSLANQALNRRLEGMEPAVIDRLEAHAWPGNVRELENTIKRSALVARGTLLTVHDLALDSETPPSGTSLPTQGGRCA